MTWVLLPPDDRAYPLLCRLRRHKWYTRPGLPGCYRDGQCRRCEHIQPESAQRFMDDESFLASLISAREATDSGGRTDLDDAITAFGFDKADLQAELDREERLERLGDAIQRFIEDDT